MLELSEVRCPTTVCLVTPSIQHLECRPRDTVGSPFTIIISILLVSPGEATLMHGMHHVYVYNIIIYHTTTHWHCTKCPLNFKSMDYVSFRLVTIDISGSFWSISWWQYACTNICKYNSIKMYCDHYGIFSAFCAFVSYHIKSDPNYWLYNSMKLFIVQYDESNKLKLN